MSCATQCSYVTVIVHTYIVPLHLHVHACAMRELIDHYKNECKVNLSFITFSLSVYAEQPSVVQYGVWSSISGGERTGKDRLFLLT